MKKKVDCVPGLFTREQVGEEYYCKTIELVQKIAQCCADQDMSMVLNALSTCIAWGLSTTFSAAEHDEVKRSLDNLRDVIERHLMEHWAKNKEVN